MNTPHCFICLDQTLNTSYACQICGKGIIYLCTKACENKFGTLPKLTSSEKQTLTSKCFFCASDEQAQARL